MNSLPGEPLLIYTCYPLQSYVIDTFPERDLLCYDWTDDFTQFELLPVSQAEMAAQNDRLVRQADVVMAVSSSLFRRAKAMNPNTVWMPNATALRPVPDCYRPG